MSFVSMEDTIFIPSDLGITVLCALEMCVKMAAEYIESQIVINFNLTCPLNLNLKKIIKNYNMASYHFAGWLHIDLPLSEPNYFVITK